MATWNDKGMDDVVDVDDVDDAVDVDDDVLVVEIHYEIYDVLLLVAVVMVRVRQTTYDEDDPLAFLIPTDPLLNPEVHRGEQIPMYECRQSQLIQYHKVDCAFEANLMFPPNQVSHHMP